jgi:hypothetical protein
MPPEEDIENGDGYDEILAEDAHYGRYQRSQPGEYEQIRYSEGYRPTNRYANDVPPRLLRWRVKHRTARNAGQRAANNNQRRRVAASRNAVWASINAEKDRAEMAKYKYALREHNARMKEEAENAKRVCGPRGCFGRLGKTLRKRAANIGSWLTTPAAEQELVLQPAPTRRYGRAGSTGGRRQKTRRN